MLPIGMLLTGMVSGSALGAPLTLDAAAAVSERLAIQSNPIFEGGGHALPYGQLWFGAEVLGGTLVKIEARTSTGQLFVDRVICPKRTSEPLDWSKGYPAHYGLATGLFNDDGDPLDVMTLGSDALYQQQIEQGKLVPRPVRVVGLVRMEECDQVPCRESSQWSQDFKLLAVDAADQAYEEVDDIWKLSASKLDHIVAFLGNYKGLKKRHRRTRVAGLQGRDAALTFLSKFEPSDPEKRRQEVLQCRRLVMQTLSQKLLEGLNQPYLDCINRVLVPGVFQSPEVFRRYMNYSAYQLLIGPLGDRDATLQNGIARMQARRDRQAKHYRFVGTDAPSRQGVYASSGTGNAVLEWVKTKNRNKKCAEGFPPQHYQSSSLIEVQSPEGVFD